MVCDLFFFFFQAEDGIRDLTVTGVQTCALPISFEMAFKERIRTWRIAMAAMVLLGVFVQIVGVAVYVATNEWFYNRQNIYESRAFLLLPAASPVWVQLQDLFAGRNIIPWAWRAVSQPGPALGLLTVLAVG